MIYFEKETPIVNFGFENKEFAFDTLTRFTTKLDNKPNQNNKQTYYFRISGMDKEFLDYFKFEKIKYIKFCHSAKDEHGSPFIFVDTLDYPMVTIDQSLFASEEYGCFDFTVYSNKGWIFKKIWYNLFIKGR